MQKLEKIWKGQKELSNHNSKMKLIIQEILMVIKSLDVLKRNSTTANKPTA